MADSKISELTLSTITSNDEIPIRRAGGNFKLNIEASLVTKASRAGNIIMHAGALPDGYVNCDGGALDRGEYSLLFGVIGEVFGSGNGFSSFNVPDMINRFPVGIGNDFNMADTGGEAEHTLTETEMPLHSHMIQGVGAAFAVTTAGDTEFYTFGSGATQPVGDSSPHNTLPPYLAVRFIICTGL
jgi:microcystin-dependent protein